MEQLLCLIIGLMGLCLAALAVRLRGIRKDLKSIRRQLSEKRKGDTNTLITLSGHDRSVRELAEDLNIQLRGLRAMRHRYEQGDARLREAIAGT